MSNQDLMTDMEKLVDPERYYGGSCCACLVGQVADKSPVVKAYVKEVDGELEKEYELGEYDRVDVTSRAYGVDYDLIDHIFGRAAGLQYKTDLPAALEMARELLLPPPMPA